MKLKYLPIDKSNIKKYPDIFTISLAGKRFVFTIHWNIASNAFYFDLEDIDGVEIINGRRIVYGMNMLDNIANKELPEGLEIIPLNFSNESDETGITYDNFMEQVKPYIFTDDNG